MKRLFWNIKLWIMDARLLVRLYDLPYVSCENEISLQKERTACKLRMLEYEDAMPHVVVKVLFRLWNFERSEEW